MSKTPEEYNNELNKLFDMTTKHIEPSAVQYQVGATILNGQILVDILVELKNLNRSFES